jgi:hypothetical protein
MKTLPKLVRFTLFGIAATSLFSVQLAQAYKVTLREVGANVVATGTGAINLTGLTFDIIVSPATGLNASSGTTNMGQSNVNVPGYTGFTGPTNFGSGSSFFPNTTSGDFVGINVSFGNIFVPAGYVSNTALSNSMTFNNETLASLGVTPGTYVWSWGTGLPNQNFTLIIGGAGVPDGGSTVSLLGFGLLGLAALRRKLPLLRGRKS